MKLKLTKKMKAVFIFLSVTLLTLCTTVQVSASNTEKTNSLKTLSAANQGNAPLIMNFESLEALMAGGAILTDHPGNVEGTYEFTAAPDGTKCLKLSYSVEDSGTHHAYYRVMPKFDIKSYPSIITSEYKYVRLTFMTTDTLAAPITLRNNKSQFVATLISDASVSQGKWVTTNAYNIGETDLLQRYLDNLHCTVGYQSPTESGALYLKEMAFFKTEEDAYAYYNDSPITENTSYSHLTFGNAGNGKILSGSNYGTNTINEQSGTVDITYAASTNYGPNYMAKLKFVNKADISATDKYVRILYSAKNPDGGTPTSLLIICDGFPSERTVLDSSVENTNGEFVLSPTAELTDHMIQRLSGTGQYTNLMHVSFCFDNTKSGGEYSVKGIYLFSTKAAADAFDVANIKKTVTIGENDISKYSIVIADEADACIESAASMFSSYIEALTGTALPIVDDSTAPSDYEIILGISDRSESLMGIDPANGTKYAVTLSNNKLIITSSSYFAAADAVEVVLSNFFYKGLAAVPDTLEITDKITHTATTDTLKVTDFWDEFSNTEAPDVFFDDFDTDDGYWQEENNTSDWSFQNGAYVTSAADKRNLSYLQVFEPNAHIKADFTYTAVENDGDMGVMLRYTAENAHLKAGYDFSKSVWYIEYREGKEFAPIRVASAMATLTSGTVYSIEFTASGTDASLIVNGKEVASASNVAHVTPGRIAIFAENSSVSVDNAEITLLSGIGTIMRNVVHNRVGGDKFMEGGTFVEMTDGSIVFQRMSIGYRSLDGLTWTATDPYFTADGKHLQVLRLRDGSLLWVRYIDVDGKKHRVSFRSTDDGKTWERGGVICPDYYPGTTIENVNMNDKITETTSGRIFYCQNWNARSSDRSYDGKYQIFDAVYYTDDKGKTWTECDTLSFEMEGNDVRYFAESKIIECADGTLRLYNSWNTYGCIVYSESKDNGLSWGPVVKMPEFLCARSSMAFARDPYADNETTYYMVWVNSEPFKSNDGMSRARLSLAKTTDGKNWSYIGDLWYWESAYMKGNAFLNHIVDPSVHCTEDHILIGTGLSEDLPKASDSDYHGAQRQHIWTISRETVDETATPMNKFTDIPLGAPCYDAISYVSDNGLFTGTSETTFSPATTMTRSMFVTVLGRLDGADVSKYTAPTFSDVVAGQWYTSYVEWAAANGVVNGIGGGLYGINDNVTVEQVCVMLSRYNGAKSAAASGKTLADFTDSASVSSWAHDAVKWAVENGVYAGAAGKLNPTSPASRALVATMFYNYVSVFAK